MLNIKTIADDADIIVNGYAFNRYENGYDLRTYLTEYQNQKFSVLTAGL